MRHLIALSAVALTLSLSAGYAPAEDGAIMAGMKERAQPLLYALGLLGSPYKRGGTDPEKGVDCSGFVHHVYKQTENIDLPRSARDQSRNGEAVAKADLKPGDLVFFNTTRKTVSHVGIYAGDGQFVHAASRHSKQVMVSNLNDRYWAKRFNNARRVLGIGEPEARAQ